MEVSTYHAQVTRGDKFWLIRVPEIDRSTQARHLREVETMARDLVAVMEDVEPDSFELKVDVAIPAGVESHLNASRKLRMEADDLSRRAAEEARIAARELARDMPLRDVASVLGVSHQRAHQLVNS